MFNVEWMLLCVQWIIRWCECKTFLNNIINAHRQFNLVWNKLVFIFAFAVLEMMRMLLRWERTEKKRKRESEKNEKRKTKSILLTRENNWNVNNFCVCYLHFVHVRTTKHYFGLCWTNERERERKWERASFALNTRTNVNKQRQKFSK